MNLLKKMSFLLFASLVMVSCGDDDTVDPAGPAITGLDFTITATGSGNIVEVLPSAVGATSYSVDFGSDATDDVKTTVGPKVSYTYPVVASDVTYTIKVTATAAGADSVSEEKEVTINYVAPNVIANFEDSPAVDITFYSKEDEVITTSIVTATAESATYGKVGKIVYGEASTGWKSFLVNPVKYLDLSTNDAVITMDYYQGDAKSVPVTLKLEGIKTDNDKAFTKIEVQVPTAAAAGWQKLTFDFSDAVRSGDGDGSALVLTEFHTIVLFIGVNLVDGTGDAGTYEIDNISGVDFGANVEDSDSDEVIDSLDKCPNAVGTEANDGCPEPAPPTAAAVAPTALQANVLSIYSDTYIGTDPTSWRQDWGNGTLEEDLVFGGNTIKVYSNLVFQAVGLASTVNLTSYKMVHVDVYTTTENVFKLKMADFGADDADEYPNGDDTESEVESATTQAAGVWVGHDIPLASFIGLTSKTNVGQLQIILGTSGNVWIDNIYFY
jgi:hypothetical protein